MNQTLNLQEIERRAYRSTWQDGLWDIYAGLVVICLALFMVRPETGYTLLQLFFFILTITLANLLLRAGKKTITQPRLGQVRFGPARLRRKRTLASILGLIVLLQSGIVGLTMLAWANPGWGAPLSAALGGASRENLLVAALGALFVGPAMALTAYFNDFQRGYYISILMSLAVFLLIRLNQTLYPLLLGFLILLPGLVLLLHFIKNYPIDRPEDPHA